MLNYDLSKSLSSVQLNLIQKYGSALSVDDVAKELKVESTDVEYLLDSGELSCKIICNKKRIMITSLVGYIFNVPSSGPMPVLHQEKHKVTDILDIVLGNKKLSCKKLNSYKWYTVMAKHIQNYFRNTYIEELNQAIINDFLISISKKGNKPVSDHFIKVQRCLLKNVVTYSLQEHYIDTNPFDFIKKTRLGKKANPKDRVLSKRLIKQLLNILDHSPTFKPMVILMLHSGLRIGEVLALSWSDIDEDNNIIHVRNSVGIEYDEDEDGNLINKRYEIGDTKTVCSVRDVPIDSYVFSVLSEWKAYVYKTSIGKMAKSKGNQNIAFVNKFGDIRSYQSLQKSFKRFLRDNGLGNEHITFHMLRHTYATILQNSGVDINIIRELLGHTDIQTTANYYVKVDVEPLIKASLILSEELNKLSS